MKLYRLKKEAVQFFDKKYATEIHDFEYWNKTLCVCDSALEEVEEAYLLYGIRESESRTSLCGWSNPETNKKGGARFCFSIYFPSIKHREYDEFSNGKVVRQLMDRIQKEVNSFYLEFINKTDKK